MHDNNFACCREEKKTQKTYSELSVKVAGKLSTLLEYNVTTLPDTLEQRSEVSRVDL